MWGFREAELAFQELLNLKGQVTGRTLQLAERKRLLPLLLVLTFVMCHLCSRFLSVPTPPLYPGPSPWLITPHQGTPVRPFPVCFPPYFPQRGSFSLGPFRSPFGASPVALTCAARSTSVTDGLKAPSFQVVRQVGVQGSASPAGGRIYPCRSGRRADTVS